MVRVVLSTAVTLGVVVAESVPAQHNLAPNAAFITTARFFASYAADQGTPITPTTPRRGGNPQAAKIANPVSGSPESIAAGRRTYARMCARCHGPEGKGDGGGAGAGGQPADFTDGMWEFGSSDGEVFTVIRDGTSADMESYGERISDTEIWNVVNYIRTLGPRSTSK
jgi:mono/diheme cytochrome c family protein